MNDLKSFSIVLKEFSISSLPISRQVLSFFSFTAISGLFTLLSLSIWIGISQWRVDTVPGFGNCWRLMLIIFVLQFDAKLLTDFPVEVCCCLIASLYVLCFDKHRASGVYCLLMMMANSTQWIMKYVSG